MLPMKTSLKPNLINHMNYIMKLTLCPSFLKTALLVVPLVSSLSGSTIAQSGNDEPLFPEAITAPNLANRLGLAEGYLKVYSATDEFNDGGLAYYAHSSYTIYTADGRLFKTVENHMSLSDESPELVTLPTGSYLVKVRSDKHGDVDIRVAIEAGRLTVLDLDREENTPTASGRVPSSRVL
jgi:hypothetical protein